jgi:hypothetical protein
MELCTGDHVIFKNWNGEWCVTIVDKIIHGDDGTYSFTITKNHRNKIYTRTLKDAKYFAKFSNHLKFNYYKSVGYHVFKLSYEQKNRSYKAL